MQRQNDARFDDPSLVAERIWLCDLIECIRRIRGLATAIQQNDTEAVKLWLNEGADPNAFANPRHRASALILAVVDYYDDDTSYFDEDDLLVDGTHYYVPTPGNTEIMASLLDAGANIHAARFLDSDTVLERHSRILTR